MNNGMKVCLDLHDFSVVNNRLDLLLKLKEHFPDFKVSLFTVPIDEEKDWGPYQIRKQLLKEIKKHLDWMQIIPHGLSHNLPKEICNSGYDKFTRVIMPLIEESFKRDGLPFEKGFCAPHWRWNSGLVRALDKKGWWGAVDPRQPQMLCPKKFYRYSHAIDNIDYSQEILKLHGHIYGTKNDLGRCFDNLLKLPLSVEWHFVTDFLEEKT